MIDYSRIKKPELSDFGLSKESLDLLDRKDKERARREDTKMHFGIFVYAALLLAVDIYIARNFESGLALAIFLTLFIFLPLTYPLALLPALLPSRPEEESIADIREKYKQYSEKIQDYNNCELRTDPDYWNNLSKESFTTEIQEALVQTGYKCVRIPDYLAVKGLDFVISDTKTAVSCRKWSKTVSEKAVKDSYYSSYDEGYNKLFVFSLNGFSSNAERFAKERPVYLYDSEDLISFTEGTFYKKYGVNSKEKQQSKSKQLPRKTLSNEKKTSEQYQAKEAGVKTKRIFLNSENYNWIKSKFIAFDVETTGLQCDGNEIIEVGAVRFIDGEVADYYSSLVNIGKTIPSDITMLTGITNNMLETAGKDPSTVYKELKEFFKEAIIGETVICAHNAHFDMKFLKAAFESYGIDAELVFIDTCTLARRTIKELPNYQQQTVLSYYNINPGRAHRAKYDAAACGLMLCRLLRDNSQFTNNI